MGQKHPKCPEKKQQKISLVNRTKQPKFTERKTTKYQRGQVYEAFSVPKLGVDAFWFDSQTFSRASQTLWFDSCVVSYTFVTRFTYIRHTLAWFGGMF